MLCSNKTGRNDCAKTFWIAGLAVVDQLTGHLVLRTSHYRLYFGAAGRGGAEDVCAKYRSQRMHLKPGDDNRCIKGTRVFRYDTQHRVLR
jgi:hypothetical protein